MDYRTEEQPLNRLLDDWGQNESTSCPNPWLLDDDDDDDDDDTA
jgi:hypothetical protein